MLLVLLGCRIFLVHNLTFDEIYKKLESIQNTSYPYERKIVNTGNSTEMWELTYKFIGIKKLKDNIIYGEFKYKIYFEDEDFDTGKYVPKTRTLKIPFAFVEFNGRIYLFVFSSDYELLYDKLRKHLYNNMNQLSFTSIYVTPQQFAQILLSIPHTTKGVELDQVEGEDGVTSIYLKGDDVKKSSLYSVMKRIAKNPDKEYRYKDLSDNLTIGVTRSKNESISVRTWNLSRNEKEIVRLIEYVLQKYLSKL